MSQSLHVITGLVLSSILMLAEFVLVPLRAIVCMVMINPPWIIAEVAGQISSIWGNDLQSIGWRLFGRGFLHWILPLAQIIDIDGCQDISDSILQWQNGKCPFCWVVIVTLAPNAKFAQLYWQIFWDSPSSLRSQVTWIQWCGSRLCQAIGNKVSSVLMSCARHRKGQLVNFGGTLCCVCSSALSMQCLVLHQCANRVLLDWFCFALISYFA